MANKSIEVEGTPTCKAGNTSTTTRYEVQERVFWKSENKYSWVTVAKGKTIEDSKKAFHKVVKNEDEITIGGIPLLPPSPVKVRDIRIVKIDSVTTTLKASMVKF